MSTNTINNEFYINLYNDNIKKIRERSSAFMNSFREQAFNSFKDAGIPNGKNELYKDTNLAPFFNFNYRSYLFPKDEDITEAEKFQCDVSDLDAHGIILINGYYANKQKLNRVSEGVWVGSLNTAASQFSNIIEKHYCKYAKNSSDSLVALNTAMALDGTFIYVQAGTKPNKPIQIVNIVHSKEDIFNQHRNLIVVEDNAEMTILICDHSLSPRRFLSNAVTEISVGKNARFNIIRVQNEHNNAGKITHTFINQEENSVTTSNNITLHGGLIRNNIYHLLVGEGAETNSNGLFLTDKFQHVDNFVSVEHFVPRCSSNQLFKGVLDDMSACSFNGRICVHPDAQKTNAYQRNNNILLTDDAVINTKPHLEIYADDVKCSHGATVGQLDEDALFYMRSRGISLKEAKTMLIFGFAHEVIQNIPVTALQKRLDKLVTKRLHGEKPSCSDCMLKCQ